MGASRFISQSFGGNHWTNCVCRRILVVWVFESREFQLGSVGETRIENPEPARRDGKFPDKSVLPQSDFLDAALGDRSSHTWCSILFGRELLQKGSNRCIGNGKNTKVWSDK